MHPARFLLRGFSAALALAAIAACSDALGPDDVVGLYTLEARDGHPLPALVYSSGTEELFLMGETLWFRSGGRGARTWVQELRTAGGETEELNAEREFLYRIVNGRIEIDMICGPLENCTPPPHLVLYRVETGLITMPVLGSQPALTYRLASPVLLD